MSGQLAQLYFTDDELEVLARLVEREIGRLEDFWRRPLMDIPRRSCVTLNSLRTALREAQYSLRIPQ